MTTSLETLVLKTAIGSYGYTAALKDGTIKPNRIRLDHVEVLPVNRVFPRMVRNLEFDVSEMAITTYALARSFNKPFTLLPLVMVRNFHRGGIAYNVKSGIREPKDLEGKKVGGQGLYPDGGAVGQGNPPARVWSRRKHDHVGDY